ncbi:unnamed protein product [Trichogramma brassicae]|uniref:Uncharacterized protein n=1 Tax=Trichogramma brassicae TaxID=86971 RepID=A0A6H5IYV0_9HYME|nr:unnamed protein product [Trichogramma brassicae]
MIARNGPVQRSVSPDVLCVDRNHLTILAAELKESLGQVVVLRSLTDYVQRGQPVFIGQIRIGAVSQEQLGQITITVAQGQLQRWIVCAVRLGKIDTIGMEAVRNEAFYDVVIAVRASDMKMSQTELVLVIHVFLLLQSSDARESARKTRGTKAESPAHLLKSDTRTLMGLSCAVQRDNINYV